MGMGYGSAFADVISQEDLIEIIPSAKKFFDFVGDEFNAFAQFEDQSYWSGDEEISSERMQEIGLLWIAVKDEWSNRFLGSAIDLCFHDHESEGDRYDEVEGGFVVVSGHMIRNPSIPDEVHKKIQTLRWVTFG